MTLLESMAALVIIGLSAVGFLELFQGTARGTRDAEAWTRAVAFAEAGMEAATLPTPAAGDAAERGRDASGMTRRIERQPWRDGLVEVVVTVSLPGGGAFTLRRIARAP